MCAVVCVVITVATTVVHMNRLQTLRKCVYNARSKSCTCFTESASHLMNQVSNMNPLSIIDPDEGILLDDGFLYNFMIFFRSSIFNSCVILLLFCCCTVRIVFIYFLIMTKLLMLDSF